MKIEREVNKERIKLILPLCLLKGKKIKREIFSILSFERNKEEGNSFL